MNTIKAIILEDERMNVESLKQSLSTYAPQVQVLAVGSSIEEGIQILAENNIKPDVAFLDIKLRGGLVFEIFEELERRNIPIGFDVIFITAYNEYVKTACEFYSIGYLNKPINPDQLIKAVSKVRIGEPKPEKSLITTIGRQLVDHNQFDKIVISTMEGLNLLRLRDISRLEGNDNYTDIYTVNNDKFRVSKTIKNFDEILKNLNFFRIHKSFIVNLTQVKSYNKGEGYVEMEDGKHMDVSRRRKADFFERLRAIGQTLGA